MPVRFAYVLALCSICTSDVVASESLEIDSVLLVTDDRLSLEVCQGTLVPGNRPGMLEIEVGFQSTEVDSATGLFTIHPIGVLWSFVQSDGVRVSVEPDGSWYGRDAPLGPQEILSFDASTGLGTALVTIPVAKGAERGPFHYPPLPSGASTVEIAADWVGAFEVGPDGGPIGPRWTGSFEIEVAYDEVFVLLDEPSIQRGSGASGILAVAASSDGTRVFELEVVSTPGLAEVRPSVLAIPPGVHIVPFEVLAHRAGSFRIRIVEEGELVATSARHDVVNRDVYFSQSAIENMSWSAEGEGNPIVHEHLAECVPPQALAPVAKGRVCTPCHPAPNAACLPTEVNLSPAHCEFALSTCFIVGDVTIDDVPSYQFTGDTTFFTCFSFMVHGFGFELRKECCEYEYVGLVTYTTPGCGEG